MTTQRAGLEAGVRIVADDLSGALDAAAPFAARVGCFPVYWNAKRLQLGTSVAFDTSTREIDARSAAESVRTAARSLWSSYAGLAFKKVDSVWRGNTAAEIATVAAEAFFDRIIVAPAFPEQGRVTREGGQWVMVDGAWHPVASDIAGPLQRLGFDASIERLAQPTTRIVVCDAETTADLQAIVARYEGSGRRTLWCGAGGLARALSNAPSQCAKPDAIDLRRNGPVLVIVGTAHPTAVAQADELMRRSDVVCLTIDAAGERLHVTGGRVGVSPVVLIRFLFAPGTPADAARNAIAVALRARVQHLPAPRLVIATGGETVRSLSEAVTATRLDVLGEHAPGIPIARWPDGCWPGTSIVTKSGGFGAPDLFIRLIASLAARPRQSREL